MGLAESASYQLADHREPFDPETVGGRARRDYPSRNRTCAKCEGTRRVGVWSPGVPLQTGGPKLGTTPSACVTCRGKQGTSVALGVTIQVETVTCANGDRTRRVRVVSSGGPPRTGR